MGDDVRIWHHGLVARWWAEFNQGGDDVDCFLGAVQDHGEPALDAGCGTGRLLLPLLAAGFDVDGCDASGDMLAWCGRAVNGAGFTTGLYQQPLHELELPRRYRTILVCGAFGLGGGRAQDLEGLRRLHRHLEPGGMLVMDHYLPNHEGARTWGAWVEAPELPMPWPKRSDRRRAADGTELELRSRVAALDPLAQTTTLEIQVRQIENGRETAVETGTIHINLYFKSEIELMLGVAGFREVTVTAFGEARPPEPWRDGRILFCARA
jgi:SAM-dependent methyltransferase